MSHIVNTTDKSLKILSLIKDSDGATTTDLDKILDLAPSTIHMHINTLEKNQWIIKEGNQYHISLQFLEYGKFAANRKPEYSYAEQRVKELSQISQEGADFCVEEHGKMIALFNSLNSTEDPAFDVGRKFHMHNSATGKAILAEMDEDQIRRIIQKWGLPKETDNTITSEKELFDELDMVKDRGYAYNNEEVLLGLRGVGTAIKRPDSSIVGGLSVGGPAYRVNGDKLHDELTNNLKDMKNKLENDIRKIYLGDEF